MIFYGQNGEDRIVCEYFGERNSGFFLDVGALDGINNSNTYAFEQVGWNGICVEAHPKFAKELAMNRSCITMHAAVSYKDNLDGITFYASQYGGLSTLDRNLIPFFEKKFKKHDPKWTSITVPMRSLSSILNEFDVSEIDLMSLDIEGGEIAALMGLDFNKHRPSIAIIEALNQERVKITNILMINAGYQIAGRKSNNIIYCNEKIDVVRLREVCGA